MSETTLGQGRPMVRRRSRRGRIRGFLLEVLILVAALVVCVAVLVQSFGASAEAQERAETKTEAITLAQTVAEEFAADPEAMAPTVISGELVAEVTVSRHEDRAGTLYMGTIDIRPAGVADGEVLYSLDTGRYVPAGSDLDAADDAVEGGTGAEGNESGDIPADETTTAVQGEGEEAGRD